MLINDENFEIIAQVKHQRLREGYPIDIREKRKQNTRKSSGRSHPATPALISAAVVRIPRRKCKTGPSNKIRHRHGVLEISLFQIFSFRKMLRLVHLELASIFLFGKMQRLTHLDLRFYHFITL